MLIDTALFAGLALISLYGLILIKIIFKFVKPPRDFG